MIIAAIRSAIFSLVFYIGSLPLVLYAFITIWISQDALVWSSKLWSRYHYFCCRIILGLRINVEGQLSDQPVLYAIKHESMFETLDIPRFFTHPIIIAKKQLFSIPFWGRAAIAYGMIPIDRDGGARALRTMLTMAKAALANGKPIIIFPEGTRVPHGESPPLQSGFAGLYKMLKVPVVPMAVDSGRLSPKRHRFWRSGTITYRIGEPIPPGLSRAEIEERVHSAINALNGNAAINALNEDAAINALNKDATIKDPDDKPGDSG